MNVIFVDIDGPLVPQKMHYFGQNRKTGKQRENYALFDQWGVRAHNLWARYSEAKIVFSTHWHGKWTTDDLKDLMRHNGLGFNYHEDCVTPKKMSSNKVDEIFWWLEQHPECTNFIAVEDDTTCRYLEEFIERRGLPVKGRWIEVDYSNGISMENFKDGCEQLGIEHDVLMFEEFGIKPLTPEEKANMDMLLRALVT